METVRRGVHRAAVGTMAAVLGYQGVLVAEILVARRVIGVTDERPPSPDTRYGDDLPGPAARLLVLGDSAAVGYGVTRADQTPPALIGLGLSHVLGIPVDVRSLAAVGARTADLREQIDAGLPDDPDLAVIVVGANDITHSVPRHRSARMLEVEVRRLVEAGVDVVVGTCPDLGTVRPIPQPLRWVARRRSRALARRQTIAVVAAGGRAVSLGELLAPMFEEKFELMFGADRFHPSADGYANLVSVLVPSIAAALRERRRIDGGAPEASGVADEAVAGRTVSLEEAAARAGRLAGTEVRARGRLAQVLRRRRG